MIEKYRDRKMTKHAVIYMPVGWCEEFGINIGEKVDITYDNKNIFIEKADSNSTYNKRYVSEANTVNIPKEIKQALGITASQPYSLYIDRINRRFIVSLLSKDEVLENEFQIHGFS